LKKDTEETKLTRFVWYCVGNILAGQSNNVCPLSMNALNRSHRKKNSDWKACNVRSP